LQATDEAPVRTFPRQRVVEAVEPLSKVECGTRASPIQAVVAFNDYIYLGLSIPLCDRRVSIHMV